MLRLALPWILLLAGSAAVASSAPAQDVQPPIEQAIGQAKREAAAAEALRQRAERAATEARGEAARLRLQQLAAVQSIAAEEARISLADAEGRLLGARLEAQRQALARERAPVSSLLAALAMIARQPPLAMIADSRSPQELVKLKLLVEAIAPHVKARSAALAARLDRGRALERAGLAARARALASRERLERRKVELAALESEALELAERSGGEAVGAGDVLISRDEQAALLEQRAVSSRRAFANASRLVRLGQAPARPGARPPPPPPIRYRMPAAAPVVEGLGNIGESGVRSRGITLATRRGAEVVAPADGIILFSGPFGNYDGIVILDHGRAWRSVLVNVGSATAKGSRVGIGDRLGTALGPVEVQLRHRGKPVSAALIAGSSQLLSKAAKSD